MKGRRRERMRPAPVAVFLLGARVGKAAGTPDRRAP